LKNVKKLIENLYIIINMGSMVSIALIINDNKRARLGSDKHKCITINWTYQDETKIYRLHNRIINVAEQFNGEVKDFKRNDIKKECILLVNFNDKRDFYKFKKELRTTNRNFKIL
tara:strand:- start:47 stop:391 length:345 start_codon:yes stop_codon:yes gene_type:complete